MKYAEGTVVSADKSLAEIKQTLIRYGASKFAITDADEGAVVRFVMNGREVRFVVKLPALAEFARSPQRGIKRSAAAQLEAHDQAVRQRYRALLLVIKAKLEAIESGIETFDEAFLSHFVLKSGETVAEWAAPQMSYVISGQMPPLLPAPQER